jgi:sugar phosphate isomerase/epimerase
MPRITEHVQIHIPFTLLHESYLDYFVANGFNPEIYLNSDALDTYSMAEFDRVAATLHQAGLRITLHSPFWDLSPGSPDSAVRELTRHRFEQTIQLVTVFKPRTVVCHTGYDGKRYGTIKEAWLENSVAIWAWVSEKVSAAGACLVLENVYEHYPDDILIVLQRLDHERVGFCLDVGHQAAFSRAPTKLWIDVLGHRLKQLHLHDNLGEKDDHLALGRGNISFLEVFNYLTHLHCEPMAVTIEPHREQDLLPSLEYLERIWPWAI